MSASLVIKVGGFSSKHEAQDTRTSLLLHDITLNDIVDDIDAVDIRVVTDED